MDENRNTFDDILAQIAAAPEVEPALRLRVGETIDERFVIEEELGKGGMGRVYLAHDTQLDRRVAIKLLTGLATDDALDRLLDEAKAMAALSHPNVVSVHEVGSVNGQMFLAMEHMPGGSLREYLESSREQSDIIARFIEAGRGLEAAHREGLVHRDFKPDNVLLGKDGRACVADFGLARSIEVAPLSTRPTGHKSGGSGSSGDSAGTPAYMAPEQLEGSDVDARCDQFSFCVALWEALTGELPFKGRAREETPSPPQALPPPVRRALRRGLAIDPDERYDSMTSLLAEITQPMVGRDSAKVIIITATLAFTAAAAAVLTMSREAASVSCASDHDLSRSVWSNERRDGVRGAFESSKLAYAPTVLRKISVLVPERLSELERSRARACSVAKKSGLMSDATYQRALSCFDALERRLEAQVSRWESADEAVVKRAMEAIRELPSPAQCLDARHLGGRALPPDAGIASDVGALQQELAEIEIARSSGKLDEVESRIGGVIESARSLGYAPLLAEVLLIRGMLLREQTKIKDAEEVLREAYVTAREGDAEAIAAAVTRELAYGLAIHGADAKAAALWRDLLVVDANKGIGGPRMEFKALDALGAIEDFQGNYPLALEHRQRAHRLATDELADSPLVLAQAEANLGLSWHAVGKLKSAVASYTRALEILESEVGKSHPSRGRLLDNAGLANAELGNTELAVAQLEEAIEIERELYGERAIEVGYTLLNLGVAFHHGEDYDKAIVHYKQALEIVIERLGASHPDVALVQNSLGVAYEGKGQFDEAVAWQRKALEIVRAKNEDHPDVARFVANIGESQRKGGDLDGALASFDDAIARWEKLGEAGPSLVHPLTGAGETLTALGRAKEAVARLERALKLASGGETSTAQTDRINKALAEAHAAAKK